MTKEKLWLRMLDQNKALGVAFSEDRYVAIPARQVKRMVELAWECGASSVERPNVDVPEFFKGLFGT
jgi:hypothetical protein